MCRRISPAPDQLTRTARASGCSGDTIVTYLTPVIILETLGASPVTRTSAMATAGLLRLRDIPGQGEVFFRCLNDLD